MHFGSIKGGEIGLRVVGENSMVYVDDSTALEIVHRLHIKPDPAQSAEGFDGVFPKWATQSAEKVRNKTWKVPVEVGFRYLIRLHFKNEGVGGAMFKILINEMIAETVRGRDRDNIVLYKDYMVDMKGRKQISRREILISLQSFGELEVLAGFEIVKLSNPDNSLASPNPMPPPQEPRSRILQILISVLGYQTVSATIAIAAISLLSIILHELREIWEARSTEDEHKPSAKAERLCRRFSLAEIQLATRNFDSGLLIGRGGFGKVYKGFIDRGQTTVAVKRLKSNSRQGALEFLTEIETLTELRHINLVSLIGYCSELREMILVYEFMISGTLADHLYKLGRYNSNHSSLIWKQRLDICVGAARGLEYLHTGHRVIHRDIKASNILLDENFVAKVSDFGLAKPEDRLRSHVSTKVKGTFGYLDPYYLNTQKLTRKSDTYAFGVVLLEALCGRPAIDSFAIEDERILTRWARDKIDRGEVDQIVDSSLRDEISVSSLKAFAEIANRCLHDEPEKRPTMAQVVVQLEFALDQQESKQRADNVANDVYPSIEDSLSSEDTEEKTFTSPTKQTNSCYSPTAKGDGKKPKSRQPLRFWTWGAFRNRIKPSKRKELIGLISELSASYIKLPKFDLTSIATATNQFSDSQKIGDSVRCSVYKAVLPTGQTVGIKRFSLSWLDLSEFKNEIFLTSRFNHHNIINLLGYCIHENGEAILVYDYMAHGTLFDHLHNSGNSPFTWKQRLQICIDAAKGLSYLHTGFEYPIIHRNIKSTSILLDERWIAKLSDFSQSRAGPSAERDTHFNTLAQVTLGYLDPEYFQTSRLTEKSDVYSYGVVLFEVLCGRKAMDISLEIERRNLATWATSCFRKGKLEEIVDSSLNGDISPECLKIFAETAIACVDLQGVDRPAMRNVVRVLESAMHLVILHWSLFILKWHLISLQSVKEKREGDETRPNAYGVPSAIPVSSSY
ncbi:putative receptor-like protein kinase At5g39000 [Salvia hispanica]|uniref:putative receptor-like protein kinase At5g39000 n=1 Tax=Salvia hispanica TaxID=49212 RepID=UPI00200981F6|nr:putative receptor-like protein kinase At5g39000 [Salvia hispanica]